LRKRYLIIALGAVALLLVGMFLNDVILAKKEPKPGSQIITITGYSDWTQLDDDVWLDLAVISDVEIPKGANVVAMGVANFYCPNGDLAAPLALRFRADNMYGEARHQGWGWFNVRETIEIHHTWTNLDAGTRTFALQYHVVQSRTMYVKLVRLTLMIFQ
jgi:hypothetical protein